jgi:hypothetical protein
MRTSTEVHQALSLVISVTLLSHLISLLRDEGWEGRRRASVFRRMNSNTAIQVLVRSGVCVCVCVCVCWFVCGCVGVHVVHEHDRTMTRVVL